MNYPSQEYRQINLRVFLLRIARKIGGEKLLWLLGRLCYRLKVEREERIPAAGACLFAYNHVGYLVDGLVYLCIRRRRPDVHLIVWKGGENFIQEILQALGLHDAAQRLILTPGGQGLPVAALLQARQILLQGGAIALAPEGEMTWDGRLQYPLAPGCAWLALRTGAAILPIVSIGGYDIQPRWQLSMTNLTGRLTLRCGAPLRLTETPLDKVDIPVLEAANQRLWENMAALAVPLEGA